MDMKNDEKNLPSPVVSTPVQLPLRSLDWDHFEVFCTDFVASSPNVVALRTHRYGRPGDDQKGIDIFTDLTDGKHPAFQGKDYETFGETEFKNAVAKTTYTADSFTVMVAGRATTQARDECKLTKGWNILDGDDLSREVRRLPTEERWRIVKTHFGDEWVEKFLGLPVLSPFLTPEQFFERFSGGGRYFHHDWKLAGRSDQIQSFEEFLQSTHRIYLLEGRGGIGKTKLLKEFTTEVGKKHLEFKFRFVDWSVPLDLSSFSVLSDKPYVIILDDAHQKEPDITALLGLIARRDNIKIVLSTRPQGKALITSLLTKNRFELSQIKEAPKLNDLGMPEAVELAKQALGNGSNGIVQKLANVARDCPLILVIGGQLIAQKKLPLELLERDEDFRACVLDQFRDEMMGKISSEIEPEKIKKVLDLTSLIQPVNPENKELLEQMAEFTKIERVEILNILGLLEEVGLLLRRGYSLRIMPDVLGDHIAARACLTKVGQSNGYSEAVFQKFAGISLESLLKNLGELDWRVNQTNGKDSGLLEEIWKEIFTYIKTANNADRSTLLKKLKDVAFYQPKQLFEIVEYVKNNPSTSSEDAKLEKIYKFEHTHVLAELPDILQRIAYNPEYLPKCADLLWELGRGDTRRLNQYPNHAMRILQDMAQYDIYELTGKTIQVNQMMLEAVTRWLKDAHVHEHSNSPLDVVDQFLDKESNTDTYDGGKITFHSFGVHYENTKKIREEALKIVVACASSDDLRTRLRAIKSLSHALEPMRGLFGRDPSDKEIAIWEPFQIEVLEQMDKIASKEQHPLVQLEIKDAIHWHVRYGKSPEITKKAKTLYDRLAKPFEVQLYHVMEKSYDRGWFVDDDEKDYEKMIENNKTFRQSVAKEFVKEYPDSSKGLAKLNVIQKELSDCSENSSPHFFLAEFAKLYPEYTREMVTEIIQKPQMPMSIHVGRLLVGLLEKYPSEVSTIAQSAIKTENKELTISIADYYWVGLWTDHFIEVVDLPNLKSLLSSKFQFAKKLGIMALGRLGKSKPDITKGLLLSVELDGNKAFAEAFCDQFDKSHYFDPDLLTPEELQQVLDKLELVDDIDEHSIEEFLEYASKRAPLSVVRLLIKRIDICKSQREEKSDYRPFSYTLQRHFTGVKESPEYPNVLRELRNRLLGKDGYDHFWTPLLFKSLSNNFDETALSVLLEWVETNEKEKLEAVGELLHEAPENFIFQHSDFVEKMLLSAATLGGEAIKSARSHLAHSVIFRGKSGTVGQPMPQDVELKEKCIEMLGKVPNSSPLYEFYGSLSKYAEHEIEDQVKRTEEFLD